MSHTLWTVPFFDGDVYERWVKAFTVIPSITEIILLTLQIDL